MNRMATEGALGQTIPVHSGITPGSGPAHLSLFGYDPLEFEVGRGVIEAIKLAAEAYGISFNEFCSQLERFGHGTTVGLNALF